MATTVRQELEEITREVAADRPELAERLARIAEHLPGAEPDAGAAAAGDYISTGDAAGQLGVSVNTIKKWVRTGVIRDFWTLPASGYIKVARAEVDRIRAGAPAGEDEP